MSACCRPRFPGSNFWRRPRNRPWSAPWRGLWSGRGRVESRLVRVHDCLWLRMWSKAQSGPLPDIGSVQDVIASIGE